MTDERDWGLTCAEVLELTTDYLERALPEADRVRFETHVETCEGCTTVLDQLQTQIEVSGQLEEDDLDPDQLDQLMDAFSDWKKQA